VRTRESERERREKESHQSFLAIRALLAFERNIERERERERERGTATGGKRMTETQTEMLRDKSAWSREIERER